MTDTIAILVGGGPAPGINGVISAATIRCLSDGRQVLGIQQGFKHIMQGDVSKVLPLTLDQVDRIHFQGGSILKTARANPTKNPSHLTQALKSLQQLGVTGLITIGGDDTCFSALSLERAAEGRLRVVHVPKTIDNDLDLPQGVPTFGFQTARHVGTEAVKSILEDARTTAHWFFVVAMGRKAGHLALAIGKAAGATLTLIPEEFPTRPVKLATIADILAGAIIKRLGQGREDGVAVLAEGIAEIMDPEDLTALASVSRDEHGHVELADLDLGRVMKEEVFETARALWTQSHHPAQGHRVRVAMHRSHSLRHGILSRSGLLRRRILDGRRHGRHGLPGQRTISPMPFWSIVDPSTQRTKVRMVDIRSNPYRIARQYMTRLERNDLEQERPARPLRGGGWS